MNKPNLIVKQMKKSQLIGFEPLELAKIIAVFLALSFLLSPLLGYLIQENIFLFYLEIILCLFLLVHSVLFLSASRWKSQKLFFISFIFDGLLVIFLSFLLSDFSGFLLFLYGFVIMETVLAVNLKAVFSIVVAGILVLCVFYNSGFSGAGSFNPIDFLVFILKIFSLCFSACVAWVVIENLLLSKRVKKNLEASFSTLQLKLRQIQQQNKDIQALSKMKTDFLKVVNHQLRTPASIIKGLASMLNEQKLPLSQKKEIGRDILTASHGLTSILDDILLAQSFVAENQEAPALYPCDLTEIIESQVNKIAWLAKQKNIKIIFQKTNKKTTIFSNQDIIGGIVFRLLENALHYTAKGKVEINIEHKQGISILVKDSGIGFTKLEKSKFFQLFFRSKRAVLAMPNGSGLGLFIAKHMALSLGGDIQATSDGENRGSVFSLTLPVRQ